MKDKSPKWEWWNIKPNEGGVVKVRVMKSEPEPPKTMKVHFAKSEDANE